MRQIMLRIRINFSLNGSLEYDFGWSKYFTWFEGKSFLFKKYKYRENKYYRYKIDVYRLIYPVVAVVTFMLVTRLNTMLIHWDCMS